AMLNPPCVMAGFLLAGERSGERVLVWNQGFLGLMRRSSFQRPELIQEMYSISPEHGNLAELIQEMYEFCSVARDIMSRYAGKLRANPVPISPICCNPAANPRPACITLGWHATAPVRRLFS